MVAASGSYPACSWRVSNSGSLRILGVRATVERNHGLLVKLVLGLGRDHGKGKVGDDRDEKPGG